MIHQEIAFFKFDQLIIFLHISFVALFIGLQAGLVLDIIRRFGLAIFALVLGIALTSLIIVFYFDDGKMQNPMTSAIVATKWAIELFLLLNLSYIFYRYKKALKTLRSHEMIELNESLIVIIYYFTPLNLLASLAAVYLGVSYRGF